MFATAPMKKQAIMEATAVAAMRELRSSDCGKQKAGVGLEVSACGMDILYRPPYHAFSCFMFVDWERSGMCIHMRVCISGHELVSPVSAGRCAEMSWPRPP